MIEAVLSRLINYNLTDSLYDKETVKSQNIVDVTNKNLEKAANEVLSIKNKELIQIKFDLEKEVNKARNTSRKLNRRCQKLEKENKILTRKNKRLEDFKNELLKKLNEKIRGFDSLIEILKAKNKELFQKEYALARWMLLTSKLFNRNFNAIIITYPKQNDYAEFYIKSKDGFDKKSIPSGIRVKCIEQDKNSNYTLVYYLNNNKKYYGWVPSINIQLYPTSKLSEKKSIFVKESTSNSK